MRAIGERVRVWAPASLSNLGPGFDALGLALSGLGDIVTAWRTDTPGITVVPSGGIWEPPADVDSNTAARAAAAVLEARPQLNGIAISVRKGILPGSGLGSSASSAAAAAWCATLLADGQADKSSAVDAALDGEAVIAGARHGDNVLPSLLGGLILVSSTNPSIYRPVQTPHALHLAVIRPKVKILTREARAMLPERVLLRDAVHNASSLAFLIDAFRAGDPETVGAMIETDRLVEPVRARLLPGFAPIRAAAREAGAYGAALSGSGPAVFAVCRDAGSAVSVLAAMIAASENAGNVTDGVATTADPVGAHETELFDPPRTI